MLPPSSTSDSPPAAPGPPEDHADNSSSSNQQSEINNLSRQSAAATDQQSSIPPSSHSKLKIPVLLLDGDWPHTLRAVRALEITRSWELHVIAPRSKSVHWLQWSRHVETFHQSLLDPEDPGWLDEILRYAGQVGAKVIFPMTEESSLFCIRHRGELERLARLIPLASEEIYRTAIDKGLLAKHLESCSLPHPRTLLVTAGDCSGSIAEELTFPVIVKPRRGAFGVGIQRVEKPGDLPQALATFSLGAGLLVQEYIHGDDLDCSFIAREGQLLAWTIQRGTVPPAGDFSAAGEIEFMDDDVVMKTARQLAASLNLTGIANVDMRRDSRTGRIYIFEINARIWASLLGSVAAGVNFPDLCCRAAMGMAIPETHQKPIRFTTLGFGVKSFLLHLSPFSIPAYLPGETHFPFMMKDPLPEMLQGFRRWVKP